MTTYVISLRRDYEYWRRNVATPEELASGGHKHIGRAEQLRGLRLTATDRVIHVGRSWDMQDVHEIAKELRLRHTGHPSGRDARGMSLAQMAAHAMPTIAYPRPGDEIPERPAQFFEGHTAFNHRESSRPDPYAEFAARELRAILANRDKLVRAWVAETGIPPSESVLVEQRCADGSIRVWVERKENAPARTTTVSREVDAKSSPYEVGLRLSPSPKRPVVTSLSITAIPLCLGPWDQATRSNLTDPEEIPASADTPALGLGDFDAELELYRPKDDP